MSKFKPHIALLVCNILWAMDYPFYNIVLPEYVHPMAMVSGSLIATALLSLIPLAWEKSEKVARTDIRRLIGAALLIGVLIGVSALVPIVGAYVGAFTSALLLVMIDPMKAVIFLVFLVCLQQFEGNVIYPRVVGTSLGLPGIWVLAAVTVGGGLFGFLGMLLSVPVASVLYTLLRRDVRKRLDTV